MMMRNLLFLSIIKRLWSLMPLGGSLPDDVWQSRHRFMVGLTWFHAILIALVGPVFGYSWEFGPTALFHKGTVLHTIAEGSVVAFFAVLASSRRLNRIWRASAVGFGLMSSSGILVHLSGGYIEFHFHFFVMVVFMALYQDWTPYTLAILYVAVHHGIVGVLWPEEVYNHTAALNAPWTWAAIHAFFVTWASIGSIIAWRFNEKAFGQTRLVLDSAAEGIFGINKEREIIFMNVAGSKMFGLDSVHVMGKPISQILRHTKADGTIYSDDESPILAPFRNGASCYVTDEIFWRTDGTSFAVDFRSSPITERGDVDGVVVTFNDVTERKRTAEVLQQTNQTLRTLIQASPLPIVSLDPNGNVTMWNPAAEHTFGWSTNEILGQFFPIVPDDKLHEFRNFFNRVLRGESLKDIEVGRQRKDRSPIDISFSAAPLRDGKGHITGVVGIIADVSERKRVQKALAEQAIRDALTGLYNRRYFNDRMPEEIARADRHQKTLAILLCDLDHFKAINDTRGHQVGDEVLNVVARSIQESTRGTDLVFRWGGDEIVVILSDATRDGILTIAERIRKGIQAASEQTTLALDLSIGVALYPEHGRHVDELIRLADRALYIAKKSEDKIHIGEEEYRLDEHAIKVVFQPVMDVSLNKVLGYEALSRDPQGKLSVPELFRRYHAVGQLTELKCLCFKLQLKAAQQIGLKRVFINVDFGLLHQLESVSKPAGLEVTLEISELEALHDVDHRLGIAQKWREKGFKFAIDDFGAGFVSLPFIARLIPEYIKLDRSTVLQAVASENFRRFLQDLLRAIQNYSKEGIIAEGIETEKELEVVKALGIHLAQGFLLGKPQELHKNPTS
jgi:diguanylate cyclase (GGDEF)-like protein/PAS domain S-box-containing protein